ISQGRALKEIVVEMRQRGGTLSIRTDAPDLRRPHQRAVAEEEMPSVGRDLQPRGSSASPDLGRSASRRRDAKYGASPRHVTLEEERGGIRSPLEVLDPV